MVRNLKVGEFGFRVQRPSGYGWEEIACSATTLLGACREARAIARRHHAWRVVSVYTRLSAQPGRDGVDRGLGEYRTRAHYWREYDWEAGVDSVRLTPEWQLSRTGQAA